MSQHFESSIIKAPKAEFHLHIEGALPLNLLAKIDSKFEVDTLPTWNNSFRFADFSHFDETLLGMAVPFYNTPERYAEASEVIFKKMLAQNIKYAEVSFASGIVQFLKISGDEISEAIAKSVPQGMTVKIFMGIHHDGRPQDMEKVFEDSFAWKYLDGVDLHGDERVAIEDWTAQYWHAMRDSQHYTKAHAGELCGADFVERIIDELGVKQIEHGVRASENSHLMKRIASENIVLDVCPTSNVKLQVCDSYKTHPLRTLKENNIQCTINSDDPLVFGSDLVSEFNKLHQEMNFSQQECIGFISSSWNHAKIDNIQKQKFIEETNAILKSLLA